MNENLRAKWEERRKGQAPPHFLVTPELERAALLCFASYLMLHAKEEDIDDALQSAGEIDARFGPILEVLILQVAEELERALEEEKGGA